MQCFYKGNGELVMPNRADAQREYRNQCRTYVLSQIQKANEERKDKAYFKDLDDWLVSELKQLGFSIYEELVSEKVLRWEHEITKLCVSWS